MNRTIKRLAIPAGAAAILATSGFAFMANNSVPETFVGSGSDTISGYAVSNVHYVLDPSSLKIDAVQFQLNHAADPDNVRASIEDTKGHAYNDCSQDAGTWTCAFSGGADGNAVMWAVDRLTVTAAQ